MHRPSRLFIQLVVQHDQLNKEKHMFRPRKRATHKVRMQDVPPVFKLSSWERTATVREGRYGFVLTWTDAKLRKLLKHKDKYVRIYAYNSLLYRQNTRRKYGHRFDETF